MNGFVALLRAFLSEMRIIPPQPRQPNLLNEKVHPPHPNYTTRYQIGMSLLPTERQRRTLHLNRQSPLINHLLQPVAQSRVNRHSKQPTPPKSKPIPKIPVQTTPTSSKSFPILRILVQITPITPPRQRNHNAMATNGTIM